VVDNDRIGGNRPGLAHTFLLGDTTAHLEAIAPERLNDSVVDAALKSRSAWAKRRLPIGRLTGERAYLNFKNPPLRLTFSQV